MRILLTGGGTAGSVSPLLAVYSRLQHPPSLKLLPALKLRETGRRARIKSGFNGPEVLWLGTKNGPERKMVEDYGIKFKPIFSGKLRRYFDLRNLIDIFRIGLSFIESFFIILKFKPNIILSAGSFVSVPVVWAGWIWGRKILIHQQDVRPGLANKLMAPFATKITVTFEESLKHFPKSKTVWTGNPVRQEILEGERERAVRQFRLEQGIPTLLVMGGGTGSATINRVMGEAVVDLVKFCQIIHTIGRNKKLEIRNKEIKVTNDDLAISQMVRFNSPQVSSNNSNSITNYKLPVTGNNVNKVNTIVDKVNNEAERMINDPPSLPELRGTGKCQMINFDRYHPIDFLNVQDMADAYAVANVVVSRCGMSSMTELSALGKPTIFIPLEDTHQEDNARLVLEKKAGAVIWQGELTIDKLVKMVKNVIKEGDVLSGNMRGLVKDGGEEMVPVIKEIVKK